MEITFSQGLGEHDMAVGPPLYSFISQTHLSFMVSGLNLICTAGKNKLFSIPLMIYSNILGYKDGIMPWVGDVHWACIVNNQWDSFNLLSIKTWHCLCILINININFVSLVCGRTVWQGQMFLLEREIRGKSRKGHPNHRTAETLCKIIKGITIKISCWDKPLVLKWQCTQTHCVSSTMYAFFQMKSIVCSVLHFF